MSELRNCPKCHKVFNFNGLRDLCLECHKKNEEDLLRVIKYVRKQKSRTATFDEVVEETNVTRQQIYDWIRDGRLHRAIIKNVKFICEICGRETTRVRICSNCLKELNTSLTTVAAKDELEEKQERKKNITFYLHNKPE